MNGLHVSIAALRRASAELNLALVVLFGSRATGSPPPGPESDVDLAVLEKSGRRGRLLRIGRRLDAAVAGAPLDLVLLSEADPLLRHEIMSGGKLLYGRVGDFLEFKAYAYRAWVDSQDLLRLEDALLEKKLNWLRHIHGKS